MKICFECGKKEIFLPFTSYFFMIEINKYLCDECLLYKRENEKAEIKFTILTKEKERNNSEFLKSLKNYTTKTISILFWVTIFLIICLIWNIFKFFNEIVNFFRSLVPKTLKPEIVPVKQVWSKRRIEI